jgi:hypothetical protein
VVAKLASKWPRTVRAWADLRLRACRYGAGSLDDLATVRHQARNLDGHIGVDEAKPRPEITLRGGPYDVPDLCRRYADVVAAQHPGLRRYVENLVWLHHGGVFHLDETPSAPPVRLENVDANDDVVPVKCSFKNRYLRRRRDQLLRPGDCGNQMTMIFRNENSIGVARSSDNADVMPSFEQAKRLLIEPSELRSMNLQPQTPRAMFEGSYSTLGEPNPKACSP